ncbi:MAG: A/G-specific adenine glycosylase [Phycisphaerales bacterium]
MSRRDRAIAERITTWFRAHRRDLPWRPEGGAPRNPYHALVSEAMLQQTQVARVAERFGEFLERFPTVEALAQADEQSVLSAWSGLGYYRRARNLHGAAKMIVEEFGGVVPSAVDDLRRLPGVGRYTAGAIASIVYGRRAALVDANVVRVVLRLEGRELAPTNAEATALAWERATALVEAAADPGAFNEGLMELGALVCRPRAPRCTACPLARRCVARREGREESIPAPQPRVARKRVHHACVLIEDKSGRLLVEQRPDEGMWAGLWQAPTVEGEAVPDAEAVAAAIGLSDARGLEALANFTVATTHRLVEFHVWRAVSPPPRRGVRAGRRWATRSEVAALPLASPHRQVLLGEGLPEGAGPGGAS